MGTSRQRAPKSGWRLTAVAAILFLAGQHLAAEPTAPSRERSPPALALIGETEISPRLREITLETPILAIPSGGPIPGNPTGRTKVRVLLPEGYDADPSKRYPVLYLFHGGTGNQADWTTPANKGAAEALTAGVPLIVVMPDGGVAGGYSDWYNNGSFGPPEWMTYHLDLLIPWIDAHYRTVADRSGRATAGLSMGGGGLRYAALRPDLIGITASFSGDIDILQPASDWNGLGAPISKMIWGDRKTQEVRWRGASAPDLAKNLINTDVAIFTGDTGRPEGTYIVEGASSLHERLVGFGIAHAFTLYRGMTHSWPNWNRALAEWLPHLMGRLRAFNPQNTVLAGWTAAMDKGPIARPTAFSYSTIRQSYSLYGWSVNMQRRALEFGTLEVFDRHHFSVVGSGTALVAVPAIGKRNSIVRVEFTAAGRSRHVRLQTDATGKLTVPVALGPANPFQQYTAEADAASTGPSSDDVAFKVFNNGSRFYRVNVRIGR